MRGLRTIIRRDLNINNDSYRFNWDEVVDSKINLGTQMFERQSFFEIIDQGEEKWIIHIKD